MRSVLLVFLSMVSMAACDQGPSEISSEVTSGASRVEISAPADGAKIASKVQIQVDYDVTLGTRGDHAHLYVDDRRIAMLRHMEGSYMLFPLDPGIREICIKVVNSNHTPIGVSRCVKVTVG
jgi:hypothetical protein